MLAIGSVKKGRLNNKIIFLTSFLLFLTVLLSSNIQKFFVVGEALTIVEESLTIGTRLTISPPAFVNLSIFVNDQPCPTQPNAYCLGETINISNELENLGVFNASGNLFTRILNSTPVIINQTNWTDVNVSTGETVYKNTSYTIREEDQIDLYSILSNYSYDENFTIASCDFWIYKDIGLPGETPRLSVYEILLTIAPGHSINYTLDMWLRYACDNTTVKMNTSSDAPGNWTSFNPEEILMLPTGEINSTNITVTVPNGTDYGTYYGWIYANADGEQRDVNLTIIVAPVNFHLKTTVPPDKKEVCQGSDIYARVNITKLFSGQADINMTYQILYNGSVLAETKDDSLTLNDTFNSTIRIPILKVPSDAELDYHTFLAILQSDGNWTESSDTFKVIPCPEPPEEEDGDGGDGWVPSGGPPTKKQLILNLSTNLISVTTGNRTSFVATVENTGNTAVKDVKISIEGISSDWIETIPSIMTIPEKRIQGYLVMINVPSYTKTGIYRLKVKATDSIESNSENLTLVIGANIEEIANLMLIEYQKLLKEATQSLLVEDCLDVTFMKIMHEDAQLAFGRGLEEYEKKNYAQAINWFEYAIPLEQKVIARVDISVEMELLASNTSKIIIPPFYEPEEQFIRAQAYLEEKNYEEVCDPIEKIRKFIMVGLIFWPGIVIIIVLIVIFSVFYYRYKRRRQRSRILEEVRKRINPET